jgi:hypothetical protein
MIKILVSVLIIVALLASGTQAFANEVFKPLDIKLKAKKLFKKVLRISIFLSTYQ